MRKDICQRNLSGLTNVEERAIVSTITLLMKKSIMEQGCHLRRHRPRNKRYPSKGDGPTSQPPLLIIASPLPIIAPFLDVMLPSSRALIPPYLQTPTRLNSVTYQGIPLQCGQLLYTALYSQAPPVLEGLY